MKRRASSQGDTRWDVGKGENSLSVKRPPSKQGQPPRNKDMGRAMGGSRGGRPVTDQGVDQKSK